MQEYILNIKDLYKTYQKKIALNKISLKIPKGSIYGLIGQNGAGKTTLIRVLNKIIDADSGSVYFNNKIITDKEVSKIGYLPEERGLYKNMSIEEQALYFGQLKGMSKKEAKDSLNYWLQRFDILDWKKKKIEDLSKGMAQKVQFIITVIHHPELLILDEPFSGFDPINANLIANEIKELAKKGTTVIFSSHRMESVAEMCDALSLIHQGTILLEGSIEQIQEQNAQEIFEITFEDYNELELNNFIENECYNVDVIIKTTNQLKLEVINLKAGNKTLQQDVFKIGTLKLYKQHVPSLEEIFIKTIKNA